MQFIFMTFIAIVTVFVIVAWIRTIQSRKYDEAVVLNGEEINAVSRSVNLSEKQFEKDRRIKYWFFCS